MRQLTIDGGEVDYVAVARRASTPLTNLQIDLLRWLDTQGSIRSVTAGIMVHSARGWCGFGNKSGFKRETTITCCPYASTDGNEAMKRLMARGIVRRVSDRGPWVRVNPDKA